MIEKLKTSKNENDFVKNELFLCKFKEKHKEGLQDKNKVKDFDRKCVAIEIENLHLKSEIDSLKNSNEDKIQSIKKLEAEILKLESDQSDSLEFEECEYYGNLMFVNSTFQLDCEFCEYSFNNKNVLKKHITKKHMCTLLTDINKQKSKLLYSLQKLNNEERKSKSIHKCKQPCLIYHERFSITKHKSHQMLEKLMEISYSELGESGSFYEVERKTDLTFINPIVQ